MCPCGARMSTPNVSADESTVKLTTEIEGLAKGDKISVVTYIKSPSGEIVARDSSLYVAHGQSFTQLFNVEHPQLWSLTDPALYTADTRLVGQDGRLLDSYTTRFGIRSISIYRKRDSFSTGRM